MKKKYIFVVSVVIVLSLGLIMVLSPRKEEIVNVGKAAHNESFFKHAEALYEEGNFAKAKTLYEKAIWNTNSIKRLENIQQRIEEINMEAVFSLDKDECSTEYIVKPNDVLSKIAKKFKTTVALIKKVNGLKSDMIRTGQKLKVNICKFSVVIDKSQNLLFLKRKGEVMKTYIVSTGADNSTPAGIFRVGRNKLKNPTWFKTGAIVSPGSPDNILGTRWMEIEGVSDEGVEIEGYGIHGTTKPEEQGRQVTLGCIRMTNKEVEELFDIIPIGTEITIVD